MSGTTPPCPCCGRTMTVKKAHLGPRAGTPYWSCSDTTCPGARPYATEERIAAEA